MRRSINVDVIVATDPPTSKPTEPATIAEPAIDAVPGDNTSTKAGAASKRRS